MPSCSSKPLSHRSNKFYFFLSLLQQDFVWMFGFSLFAGQVRLLELCCAVLNSHLCFLPCGFMQKIITELDLMRITWQQCVFDFRGFGNVAVAAVKSHGSLAIGSLCLTEAYFYLIYLNIH